MQKKKKKKKEKRKTAVQPDMRLCYIRVHRYIIQYPQ